MYFRCLNQLYYKILFFITPLVVQSIKILLSMSQGENFLLNSNDHSVKAQCLLGKVKELLKAPPGWFPWYRCLCLSVYWNLQRTGAELNTAGLSTSYRLITAALVEFSSTLNFLPHLEPNMYPVSYFAKPNWKNIEDPHTVWSFLKVLRKPKTSMVRNASTWIKGRLRWRKEWVLPLKFLKLWQC